MLQNMQTWELQPPVFITITASNKGIPTVSTSIKIPNKDIPIGYFNHRSTDHDTDYVFVTCLCSRLRVTVETNPRRKHKIRQ